MKEYIKLAEDRIEILEIELKSAIHRLEEIEKDLWLGNPDAVTEKVLLLQQGLREVL
mgnify:CR=1 FL=1|tara:strand:- start:427 stop:597 length:171 start_codon:yes stop_codon:yes gene_type:complete